MAYQNELRNRNSHDDKWQYTFSLKVLCVNYFVLKMFNVFISSFVLFGSQFNCEYEYSNFNGCSFCFHVMHIKAAFTVKIFKINRRLILVLVIKSIFTASWCSEYNFEILVVIRAWLASQEYFFKVSVKYSAGSSIVGTNPTRGYCATYFTK